MAASPKKPSQELGRKPIVAVNATALKSGGALTILRQFISHIHDDAIYYIFIAPGLNLPTQASATIHFISINTTTAYQRIIWDWFGLKRWFKHQQIQPDVVLCLQNTSVRTPKGSKSIIYIHQGLPFHPQKWSFFKAKERALAFYKYIYPWFMFINAPQATQFVVQTQWMKQALCSQFKRKASQVHVIKPELEPINTEAIAAKSLPQLYSLFYPASNAAFKNHIEVINALAALKASGFDMTQIALYLTITAAENARLYAHIRQLGLLSQVHFLGPLSYDDVLVYYKSCTTVVFPSYIETFGLPLIEAAYFGKPIVVLDATYAREVIGSYPYAIFAGLKAPEQWQEAILKSFLLSKTAVSYQPQYESNWDSLSQLIARAGI